MINSEIFSQSNNNCNHIHRYYLRDSEITRNHLLLQLHDVICNPISFSSGVTPSLPTLVNKTATTISVSWTPVSSNADGYVVNVTSATPTVIQQVKGGSRIPNTVCVSTCYGEYSTHFYNTTGEIMSLIRAVCNDISVGRCTVSH